MSKPNPFKKIAKIKGIAKRDKADKAADAKAGIKQGSKEDEALDKKTGVSGFEKFRAKPFGKKK